MYPLQIPYRTKVFIGVNVREMRDYQNRGARCRCYLPETNAEEL